MSEMGDQYRAMKVSKKMENRARCVRATETWREAADIAASQGMTLVRHTEVHYQLKKGEEWVINLYPSNQRIYSRDLAAPYLRVKFPWNLIDAVNAAAEAT